MLSSDEVKINVRNVVIFAFIGCCEILCGNVEISVTVKNFRDTGGEKRRKRFFCRTLDRRNDLRYKFFFALACLKVGVVFPDKISAEIVIDCCNDCGSVGLELRIVKVP